MNGASRKAEDFLQSPLVKWVQSYLDAPITSNEDLCNGILLNNVLNIIDPNVFSVLRLQKGNIDDTNTRSQNLAEILHGIKRFYQEKLQQLIVMKMPDILMLAKEPNNEMSHIEMQQILLLILGCAIQCDKKEVFIEHIKELEVEVQRGLVNSIQQITDNPENILPLRSSELVYMDIPDVLSLTESLYYQIQRVLDQRDEYVETILDLALLDDQNEADESKESPRMPRRHPLSPKTSFRSSNILQANRQRVQNLQSELDDRVAFVSELKEEIEQLKLQLENVRMDNKQLVGEAGWAKTLRDELDIVKAELEQANKYQQDNTKLKEKVRDLEYYKRQYEELKEQSELLYESKLVLEEKVAGSTSKMSRYSQYQDENDKLFGQVKDLMKERLEDQQRIKDLVDEVAKLSMEKQESLTAYSGLNAELDGLRMERQDDGLNVPLMVEYNQSSSTDLLRLERENEHLKTMVDTLRTSTPSSNNNNNRLDDLESDNEHLHQSNAQYKHMISKLTKALLLIDGLNIEASSLKSLLSEKSSNKVLGTVINEQNDNIKSLRGNLTRKASELEQTNIDLEELTDELAKNGIVLDLPALKEALDLDPFPNGDIKINVNSYGKKDFSNEKIIALQQKYEQAETFSKKVEQQLEQRENDILGLERRFEKKVTENKSLNQNVLIQQDKVVALEERVSHLMNSASEDTRKVNKSLDEKMKKISQLETSLLTMREEAKSHEQAQELIKLKDDKNIKSEALNKEYEKKLRELEISYEKINNTCKNLEHMTKLKEEKIDALELSLKAITTSASKKQTERIELLMSSIDTRSNDITDLEKKIEELVVINNKLKEVNKEKKSTIQELEEKLSDLEEVNSKQCAPDKVAILNKQLTDREGQIDELEVRLDDSANAMNKLKRTLQNKDDKLNLMEQKLQDLDEMIHQKEKLSHIADERSKKIIEIETKLDFLQNENGKLARTVKHKDDEYKSAMQNLSTLEDSITDQSSLSKLIQMRDQKIEELHINIDSKDEAIVDFEDRLNDRESKLKKLNHALKLKEEKISDIEQSLEKHEELETKCGKLQATLSQKDSKIYELEDRLDQLAELSRQNTRLKDNIKNKDEKIVSLEQRIDDLEEAVKMNERLNQQVQQKQERIQSLQERIKDIETQLHKSQQTLDVVKKNAEAEIMRLNDQNQEFGQVKIQRQMSIMRRDQKIVNLESRLNEYASERQQKDSEIQNLQAKLEGTMSQYRKLDMSKEEKDHKLQDLEARVKELQDTYKENRRLLRALQKKEEELEGLRKKIEDLDINNNKSSALLNNKETNINELQERLDETLSLNNRLDKSIKKHEEKINQLEENLTTYENQSETLSNDNLSKERSIERYKETITKLELDIKEKEKEISALIQSGSPTPHHTKELEDLLTAVKEKDDLLLNSQNKLSLLEASASERSSKVIQLKEEQINQLQSKLDELSCDKHKTKLNAQEKDGIIAELQRRIEELQWTAGDSDKLNGIVKEKNNQMKILREDLDEYQSNTVQLETKIDELTSELTRSTLAMKQKDERLNSIKGQLESQRTHNSSTANELQMKEEKIKSLSKSLEDMRERNKELEEDINSLEKDLQDLKKTGSLKNITNITEKIQLTKRARTELHIQRGPRMNTSGPQNVQKIEIKMSPNKSDELSSENRELIARLKEDNSCLEKQKSYLSEQIDSLSQENAELMSSNESLQSDFQLVKVDYEEIQKEMLEAKEHFQELDVSATKIAHRCEVLVQLNSTLEEENKVLMDQVNKLLSQNQDLLVTTLHSREQHMDDERAFSDHIYGLEREKEKLSEKVLAAEKALMDTSTGRKKNALWRGTHKILKKAGLKKKKDGNLSAFSPDPDLSDSSFASKGAETVNSPLGPIRGIISRSRQDLSKIDPEVSMRRPSGLAYAESISSDTSSRSRPKSDFYPQYRLEDPNSPAHRANNLYRPNSLETITSNEKRLLADIGMGDDDIVPLNRQESLRSQRSAASFKSGESQSGGSHTPKTISGSNTPIASRKTSDDMSAPIQRVRVTQSTTPKVMKAAPESTVSMDYVSRQLLDESPRAARKNVRATNLSSHPSFTSPKHDKLHGRLSLANPSTSTPQQKQSSEDGVDSESSFENYGARLNRRKSAPDSSFHESPQRRVDDELDSGSFSPSSPRSNPFGRGEVRNSFRRYEIEQMEPRPLPAGSTENILLENNMSPPPTTPSRTISSKMKNAETFFGSSEQRSSGESTSSQKEKPSVKRSNSEKKKRNSAWYEYGNV